MGPNTAACKSSGRHCCTDSWKRFVSRVTCPARINRLIAEPAFCVEFEGDSAYNRASPALQPRENSSYDAYGGFLFRPPLLVLLRK
jgi:hypothetical protein